MVNNKFTVPKKAVEPNILVNIGKIHAFKTPKSPITITVPSKLSSTIFAVTLFFILVLIFLYIRILLFRLFKENNCYIKRFLLVFYNIFSIFISANFFFISSSIYFSISKVSIKFTQLLCIKTFLKFFFKIFLSKKINNI